MFNNNIWCGTIQNISKIVGIHNRHLIGIDPDFNSFGSNCMTKGTHFFSYIDSIDGI